MCNLVQYLFINQVFMAIGEKTAFYFLYSIQKRHAILGEFKPFLYVYFTVSLSKLKAKPV